ncbi:MAG TPA: hypothetical protein VIJ14_09095 [Rhabdochlamydiaceae bacterium]
MFWPIFNSILGTFILAIGVFIPYLQYRDTKRNEREAQKAAALEKEEEEKPKYLEIDRFENYQQLEELTHDEIKKTVNASSRDVKDASNFIQATAKEMRQDQEGHAKEQREILAMIQAGISTSLSQAHEKANQALYATGKFDGRLVALEKRKPARQERKAM